MPPKAIIIDLDGTLTNVDHRIFHVKANPKNWEGFHGLMNKDIINQWCLNILINFQEKGYKILFLTGREEHYREKTLNWLKDHNISFETLWMRKTKDPRPDEVFKKEIYETFIKDQFDVEFILEDRLKVVKMWREIGLTCLQCDWGDF
jgi:uncharacterized HAD superfamily protein